MRSLLNAIDDALDTLYEPNAVFSQFQWSASMTFFSLLLPLLLLVLSFLAFLVFSCFSRLFFSVLSFFVFSLSCLFFPFLYLLFFFFFFFSNWLASVVRMFGDRYYMQYIRGSLSWVASGIVGFSRRE